MQFIMHILTLIPSHPHTAHTLTDGRKGLHVEDVTDLILQIFKANDHIQKPEAVMAWFSDTECVGFWEFFEIMATQYRQLLQVGVVKMVM